MQKTKIEVLDDLGQSIWLDNINRHLIESGRLNKMIELGLRGLTSNPTIFEQAISKSSDYDKQIEDLGKKGKTIFEIYDELTVKDIQKAADLFLPVYKETQGLDGYISLEIDPRLAYRTQETIEEGKKLYRKVARPNVMFKVPATSEGFVAIEELIALRINVNITLIFSLEQYINTAQSYIRGIKRCLEDRRDVSQVHSVASVFVSRIDTLVDKLLDEKMVTVDSNKKAQLASLKGKAAVANCKLIYKKFLEIISSEEFKGLQAKGANLQRVLWGSTSTKNPAYSDTKYVTELIAKNTVNTMPESTFEAFLDHGKVRQALSDDIRDAPEIMEKLSEYEIDINKVCTKLLQDGVVAFENSFVSLLNSIDKKLKNLYLPK